MRPQVDADNFSTSGQWKVLFELFRGVRTLNDTVRQGRISRGSLAREDQEAIGHLAVKYNKIRNLFINIERQWKICPIRNLILFLSHKYT